MNELALFAGAGGGILGGHLLGWRTVVAVERDAYAAQVLAQRQNDGCLRPFPIWSDIETFDGRPWCGLVDVVSGGFPCQDVSAAGKGAGLDGKRSGLWFEMARVIREVQPRYVYVENSPVLTSRGLGRVLGDLAEMGFDAEWGVVSAADTGAPHLRERIWIVANARRGRCGESGQREVQQPGRAQAISPSPQLAYATSQGLPARGAGCGAAAGGEVFDVQPVHGSQCRRGSLDGWPPEPELGRVADGVAHRVDRVKAIGNGQVSRVAKVAWLTLSTDNG